MQESWRDNRLVILVVLAVELLLLALWPLAARLDSSVDDVRPLILRTCRTWPSCSTC